MTNQLITYRLPIDYSLISLMSLMSSISHVWRVTTAMSHCPGGGTELSARSLTGVQSHPLKRDLKRSRVVRGNREV